MKLHLLDRSNTNNHSFSVRKNKYPYFLKMWHYHVELELVLVLKSTGTRFIGDSIEKFEEGEVFLIGENLPHMLLNDDEYFEEESNLMAEAIAVHFKKDFLGHDFLNAPEMKHIAKLIDKVTRGVKFVNVNQEVTTNIKELVNLNGFERTITFIKILQALAQHKNYQLLSSEGFVNSFNSSQSKNLDKVYEYIFKNFNKPICLSDVAGIANMNPSAFSRFFKRVNRKTFSKYLNEIRIGYACKLLTEQKHNISAVCYESGFNNISNFNRQFKTVKNITPSDYIREYHKIQ